MMLRVLFILALAGVTLGLSPILPWYNTANAIRAALNGDPLLSTFVGSIFTEAVPPETFAGPPYLSVNITVRACPPSAAPSCRTTRLRKAQALATLLSLVQGTEDPYRQVVINVTLGSSYIAPEQAPKTTSAAVVLLKRALAGNSHFSRVWDRSIPPVIAGLDSVYFIFRPAIVQYQSTAVSELGSLTSLPAAQLFEAVFKLSSLAPRYPRIRATSERCAPNTCGCRAPVQ